jgi:hypothetical protein
MRARDACVAAALGESDSADEDVLVSRALASALRFRRSAAALAPAGEPGADCADVGTGCGGDGSNMRAIKRGNCVGDGGASSSQSSAAERCRLNSASTVATVPRRLRGESDCATRVRRSPDTEDGYAVEEKDVLVLSLEDEVTPPTITDIGGTSGGT